MELDNYKHIKDLVIVMIKYGSVVGSEEFEKCFDNDGSYFQAKHMGILRIGNNVQIDEYVIIDRPLFNWDETVIGNHTFLGKKSYVGHGCKIGCNCIIAPSAFICGNTVIGQRSKIGIGSIISNRLHLGNEVEVSIGSVVNKNVSDGMKVTGYLAFDHYKFMQCYKNTIAPYF